MTRQRFGQAILLCGLAMSATTDAQQAPAASTPLEVRRTAARATGDTTVLGTPGMDVSRRQFAPGARMYWHVHSGGQLIMNETGMAIVQERGQPPHRLGPGESLFTPPNVPHWHGATATQPATLISVGFPGQTTWLEEVTDADFASASK